MKRINEQRPKAFIGTAISVGTSIVSGIIGNRKKKKAEQAERLRQERLQNLQDNQALASAQNENMMSEEERSQFLSQYLSKGGKVRTFPHKGTELRIVEGGTAIPIKKDSFLLKGRKHNIGGIVIDAGKTGVEAEGGEVVQVTPKQLKVFSAQPILNGNSPAELVQKGVEPNKVFNAQENFKNKNGLNDDGTKKKAMGGKEKKESGLARTSRSQLMQRVPKYNRLYINRGDFGGGQGRGAGTGTKIHSSDDLYTISKTDTLYVPVERNFNDAFSEARRSGQATFDFQGKKYNTQLGNNPNNYTAGQSRKEEAIVPIVRKRTIRTSNPNAKLKLGGLSRKDDYGSSKKPYPNVDKKDFAGGGRSYPIPTKADARDALRLAGLHGRSDVRAKVYKKYPELKKSALGSRTRLLKNNYNNFGLEKDYSSSFAPNTLTKTNMNSVKTNSVVPSKPVGVSISSSTSPLSKSSRFGNFMSGIGVEAISAGIGALGNIISGVTNKNSINNIQAPTRPRTIIPVRMRTTYNINPQLAESRNSERNMARIIDSNTSSSSGKIARIQSLANRGVLERNKLRGIKENVETYLLNRSALNRQGVEAANNQVLNAYDNAVTQTENEKIQARANNRTNIIEGLTSAVRDYQLGMDKRRSEENATAAIMSANPEQMELFLKLMDKNKGRLNKVRSSLFRCGGKKKIA